MSDLALFLREQFPILRQRVHNKNLVYLDNAATTQKPRCVLEASLDYYANFNSNVHRGVHTLSRQATEMVEHARDVVAAFINAEREEVVFTSGATDAINLVAGILQRSGRLDSRHNIVVSRMEHHSNIVPWQLLAQASGAEIRVIELCEDQTLDTAMLEQLVDEHTAVVACTYVSNALGVVNPVEKVIAAARKHSALVLIDAAQAIAHLPIDVKKLDCDFLVFSGHKVYAPTGTGVLWGKKQLLEALPVWRGGGEMIREVSFSGTTYADLPFKYEAGTPNIEGNIALARALKFVSDIGFANIHAHEQQLTRCALQGLAGIEGLRVYAPGFPRASVISFNIEGLHHYDVGTLLDNMGIAVRTGHHCTQPLMASLGITGTIRASFAVYNTLQEAEQFCTALQRACNMLR